MAEIPNPQTSRARRIVGIAWLALVAMVTLEIAARADDWYHFGAPFVGNYEFDRLFENTDRGLRGVPDGRYLRWTLNGAGLRGPEVQPAHGQVRVLVYGASESFGIYEETGKEFPRALEAELNARGGGAPFEVINAGIPGMRIGSGVALLRDLQARFRPRVVVMYPTPTHYIGVMRPYCGRPPRPAASQSLEMPTPRIAEKIKEEVKRVLPRAAMTAVRRASIELQARGQQVIERAPEASLDALEFDVNCALDAAQAGGMVPVLVTHANRFGRSADGGKDDDRAMWLTQWRQQYPEMREGGFLDLEDRANAVVRKVAAQRNVALVDAAAALSGHADWFADHAHFTNAGAARMGALLAPAVLEAAHQAQR